MDFVETPLASEFVFLNPNIAGTCGCGESFNLKPEQPPEKMPTDQSQSETSTKSDPIVTNMSALQSNKRVDKPA